MTQYIGFSGKKQRGKNESARIATEILENSGYTVAEYAFASTLKDMCINVFGLNPKLAYGSNEDKETLTHIPWDGFPEEVRREYGTLTDTEFDISDTQNPVKIPVAREGYMTYRELLQVMGTDIFRKMIYSEVWAEAPFRQDWEGIDIVLLTDVRFPNEVAAVESHGGHVVRIERDITGLDSDNHASETALDDHPFDTVITNNSTLGDLKTKIFDFLYPHFLS